MWLDLPSNILLQLMPYVFYRVEVWAFWGCMPPVDPVLTHESLCMSRRMFQFGTIALREPMIYKYIIPGHPFLLIPAQM